MDKFLSGFGIGGMMTRSAGPVSQSATNGVLKGSAAGDSKPEVIKPGGQPIKVDTHTIKLSLYSFFS
jgi:hypothetical protein